jgi:carbamoyltransferase
MYLLGVNSGPHDASAALLKDGRLVCMAEQERLSRSKRALGQSPAGAVVACLRSAKLTLDDVEEVAIGWNVPEYLSAEEKAYEARSFEQWLLPGELLPRQRPVALRFVPHHLAHAASGFYTSGFDEAAILVSDGRGERHATSVALASAKGIEILAQWDVTQSLGNFYGMAAEWAGFGYWGAGKLMGLASYGRARHRMPLVATPDGYAFVGSSTPAARTIGQYRQQERLLHWSFGRCPPSAPGDGSDAMAYADFAAAVQEALEAAVLGLARVAVERTGQERVVLVGGVHMNCTLNGLLIRSGLFRHHWVPPVPYDAGVALGAALIRDRRLHPERGSDRMDHAYWAPEPDRREVPDAIRASGLPSRRISERSLISEVAERLAAGEVIGWWQGRGEIGQRALGARSILCDPRSRDALRHVNLLKGRELWRPLAPSIPEEHLADIFGTAIPSAEFMLSAWPVRAEAQRVLGAAIHVDGSARPQAVRRASNPRYWSLLEEFRSLTGVPALVNTSFNLAGDPIVASASDAVSTFLRSRLDALVLGDFILEKREPCAPTPAADRR